MAVTTTTSVASMTARLISKLSLCNQDEPVDLENLRCPDKCFVAPGYYPVEKLNTARLVPFDAFRCAVRSMWRISTPVEVQARGDRFLFTFSNERDIYDPGEERWTLGLSRAIILLNDVYDGFSDIMVGPLDFVWIWVEIQNLPTTPTTIATTRLVGETSGPVLQVDNRGINHGNPLSAVVRGVADSRRKPNESPRIPWHPALWWES
ncbi:hypothetical protein ACLB2K_004227 [Fragaria x ananassa]